MMPGGGDCLIASSRPRASRIKNYGPQAVPPPHVAQVAVQVAQLSRQVNSLQVPPKVDPEVVRDPNEAYTRAVKEALVDAMIESSGHLNLGPEEWLTVAARDNVPNDPLVPGDATDLRSVIFKIKGSDLAAFRSGQLTLDKARERVLAEEN